MQEFEVLIEELRTTPDPFRLRILAALTKSSASSTLLVNRIWLKESEKDNPNWPCCLAAFKRALLSFAAWNQPILVDSAIRAIVVIADEYLGQTQKALEECDRLSGEYERDSGLLRAARITVLSNLRRSRQVITADQESLELWENELDDEQIHDVLTLRLAAIEACKFSDWTIAIELFDQAYSFVLKKEG